jgi:predicted RNase H-like HicB family nuclease
MQYLVIVEKAANNYSAFSPDVPGCAVTGKTIEKTLQLMKQALEFHLEALDNIPQPKGLSYHINSGEWEFEKGSLIAQVDIAPTRKAA